MKLYTQGKMACILFLFVAVPALVYVPKARSSAQHTPCSCDNLSACANQNELRSPEKKPPEKKPPPKPTEFRVRNVILKINPRVEDKGHPDFDEGSGTAEDTEHNFSLGRANSSGHFAERRRFIYNTLKFGEQARQNGEISQQDLERLTTILKDRLKTVNEEEKEAYRQKTGDDAAREMVQELEGRVNIENKAKTDQLVKDINKLDLEKLDEHTDTIDQIMRDNLAQARAQQLLGSDGTEAFQRFVEIAHALRNKVAKDCTKKKISINDVLRIERMVQIMGGVDSELSEKCLTRTIVARASFGGIEYEAKRCLDLFSKPDRASLAGDWSITIKGAMSGSGSAQVSPGGSGEWSGNANVVGAPEPVLIQMQGPVELVSGGGKCLMKLTSSMSVGSTMGYAAQMPGVSGNLPVSIVNEPCGVKEVRATP